MTWRKKRENMREGTGKKSISLLNIKALRRKTENR